jgi:hypothetical protein
MMSCSATSGIEIAFKILGMPREDIEARAQWDEAFRTLQPVCDQLLTRFGKHPGESLGERSAWLSHVLSQICDSYASWRIERIRGVSDLSSFNLDINSLSEQVAQLARFYLPYGEYLMPAFSGGYTSGQKQLADARRALIQGEHHVLHDIEVALDVDAREWARKGQIKAEALELRRSG